MQEVLFWVFAASSCIAMIFAVIFGIACLLKLVDDFKEKILIIFGFSLVGIFFLSFEGIILNLLYNNL